jgi:hypothetical protein
MLLILLVVRAFASISRLPISVIPDEEHIGATALLLPNRYLLRLDDSRGG